jgi:hypothetical protein
MAARMRAESGSRETAKEIYKQMLAESDDKFSKVIGEGRLQELISQDEREVIDKALEAFKNRNDRCVGRLSEIIPSLKNVELPDGEEFHLDNAQNLVDPSGVLYSLDAVNCVVMPGKDSKLHAK